MRTLRPRVPSGIRRRYCWPFATALSPPDAAGSPRSGVAVSGISYRGNRLLSSPHAGSRNPGFCTRIRTNALMPHTRSQRRMRSLCTSGSASTCRCRTGLREESPQTVPLQRGASEFDDGTCHSKQDCTDGMPHVCCPRQDLRLGRDSIRSGCCLVVQGAVQSKPNVPS